MYKNSDKYNHLYIIMIVKFTFYILSNYIGYRIINI